MYLATFNRRALTVAVTAGIALALIAGCSGDDDKSGMDHEDDDKSGMDHEKDSSHAPDGGDFNDADVEFAQMMIPHHEQAVEMATLAETQASDAAVKELAAQIKDAQDPEIETMTSWLEQWDQPVEMPGHGDMTMGGMATQEQMAELEAASGGEFDKLFVELMIVHHEGAIDMAEDETANGSNAEVKELATEISETQAAEIEALEAILDRL